MADVLIFLLRLSDVLDVDLAAAVREKLAFNEDRFPKVAKDWEK
jgi:NTP pyrophosphatase (non-canonical NTP hydrolase)